MPTANNGLVREYPHVPGIDFAGTVESSDDPRYQAGDKVVLTGWRIGEKPDQLLSGRTLFEFLQRLFQNPL